MDWTEDLAVSGAMIASMSLAFSASASIPDSLALRWRGEVGIDSWQRKKITGGSQHEDGGWYL